MPETTPNFPRGAVLDEISHKLGELSGYVHEHRHGVNNLSTKFDGLALDISKRVEALETKITVRMEEQDRALRRMMESAAEALKRELAAADARISVLEAERNQRAGATSLATTVLKSPAIGWLVGAVVTAWAVLTGKVHI